MANWVYKLNIEDLREKAKNEEIESADYMTEIVRRMRALKVAEKHKKGRDYVAERAGSLLGLKKHSTLHEKRG